MQKTLSISLKQSDYLAQLSSQADSALNAFRVAFTTVLRGADLTEARFVSLDGTALTVELPDADSPPAA